MAIRQSLQYTEHYTVSTFGPGTQHAANRADAVTTDILVRDQCVLPELVDSSSRLNLFLLRPLGVWTGLVLVQPPHHPVGQLFVYVTREE